MVGINLLMESLPPSGQALDTTIYKVYVLLSESEGRPYLTSHLVAFEFHLGSIS